MGDVADRPLVLVVDDDADVRDALVEILQLDYDVVSAGGGIEAVTVLRQRRVVAIVLDVLMPEMDGLTTLRRARQIDPTVPIVMVTALDTARSARDALKLGAVDYITKPFTCDELRAAVRSASAERIAHAVSADPVIHVVRDVGSRASA
jgi:DNA-binding NtrC family response regulator